MKTLPLFTPHLDALILRLLANRCMGCDSFEGSLGAFEAKHLASKNRNALVYTYLEEEQMSLRVRDTQCLGPRL